MTGPGFDDLGWARPDTDREARTGLPEIVFGPGKSAGQIAAVVRSLLAANDGPVLVTRADQETAQAVLGEVPDGRYDPAARLLSWRSAVAVAVPGARDVRGDLGRPGGGRGGRRGDCARADRRDGCRRRRGRRTPAAGPAGAARRGRRGDLHRRDGGRVGQRGRRHGGLPGDRGADLGGLRGQPGRGDSAAGDAAPRARPDWSWSTSTPASPPRSPRTGWPGRRVADDPLAQPVQRDLRGHAARRPVGAGRADRGRTRVGGVDRGGRLVAGADRGDARRADGEPGNRAHCRERRRRRASGRRTVAAGRLGPAGTRRRAGDQGGAGAGRGGVGAARRSGRRCAPARDRWPGHRGGHRRGGRRAARAAG